MRPVKKEKTTIEQFAFSNDKLSTKLQNLIKQNRFSFTSRTLVNVHSLGQLLYKIDFLIARKEMEDGTIVRKYFDQNRYLNDQFVDFGFDWEIHPAYRWALQPAKFAEIFQVTDLDSDNPQSFGDPSGGEPKLPPKPPSSSATTFSLVKKNSVGLVKRNSRQ
jgi:hypothetical protein